MYAQERNPGEVDEEAPQERLLAEAVLEEREAEVSGAEEHDCRREPDLETVQVETVDGELPSEQDVVDKRDGDRTCNTVCNTQRFVKNQSKRRR